MGHTSDNKDVIGFLKDFKVKRYIIWSWKDGQWLLNMDTPPQMPGNLLTTIERNKAYWVRVRERCE